MSLPSTAVELSATNHPSVLANVAVSRLELPSNAYLPIIVKLAGKATVVREVLFWKAYSLIVSRLVHPLKSNSASEEQYANALPFMLVKLLQLEKSTCESVVQFWKALTPIVSRLAGNAMLSRLEQYWKADAPMLVKLVQLLRSICARFEHSVNA